MTSLRQRLMTRQPPAFIRGFSALHRSALHSAPFVRRLVERFGGQRMLLLTTTGRRSGQPRTWPLLYLEHGDAFVVTASFGGHDRHPAWYLNLEANPDATVEVGGERVPVTARVVTGEERAQWYARFEAAYRGYSDYAAATSREIPVVVLERRAAT